MGRIFVFNEELNCQVKFLQYYSEWFWNILKIHQDVIFYK